jgi:hypothetical protein
MRPAQKAVRRVVTGIIGIGLDTTDGHSRVTHGDAFFLIGGSEDTHRILQRKVQRFCDELARRQISLEDATDAQIEEIRTLMDEE